MIKKAEVERVVQRHIQAFKEVHDWKDIAVERCYQKISEKILSGISDNATENTDKKMLEVASNINKYRQLFVIEWEYEDQYTRLSTDALTKRAEEEVSSHQVARGGMSKAEIVRRIQARIKTFETQHGWSPSLSRTCTA